MATTHAKYVGEMGSSRGCSVRAVLISVVCFLSLLLALGLIWKGADAWRVHQAARDTRTTMKGANDYINGVYELLMERLYTNNALQGEAAAGQQTVPSINRSRQIVRKQLEESGLSALEETAASLEELSTTVRQNAGNAQGANEAASEARELAVGGGSIAGQAIAAMSRIEASSRQISDIVALIEEIAFQTNILALNAAVEAARAGDAGRGFAVVANEVRALSQRSSQALKDIKVQIAGSDLNVSEGVALVTKANASLGEIVESIKKVASLVSEIATASQEQSTGIEQVNRAVGNMDQMTQQNSSLVEETSAALTSAQTQVEELRAAVGYFKTGAEATTETPSKPIQRPKHVTQSTSFDTSNPVHRQQAVLSHKMAQRRANAAASPAVSRNEMEWKQF